MGDARATTPSDGSLAGNLHHFAGGLSQTIGQLGMITNYGSNNLLGTPENSWMAQAAGGWQLGAQPASPAGTATVTPTPTPTPTPCP